MSAAALRDDAAAYALDAMDAAERRTFETLMASDATLAREVEQYRGVAALLAFAAPRVAPPPRLRVRVLEAVRDVRPISSGAPRSSAERIAPASGGLVRIVPWLAVAASLGWVLVSTRTAERESADRAAIEEANGALRSQIASLDSLVGVLLAPEVQTVTMSAAGAPPRARLYVDSASRQVVLATFSLPPAAAGRTYQLWGIPAGQRPVSLGTFNTNSSGEARVSFAVPTGVTIAVGAVTEEPAGGSPQPTTQPFLVGQMGG